MMKVGPGQLRKWHWRRMGKTVLGRVEGHGGKVIRTLDVWGERADRVTIWGRRKNHQKQVSRAAGNVNKKRSMLRHNQKENVVSEIKQLQTTRQNKKNERLSKRNISQIIMLLHHKNKCQRAV
jgi:hypothetical protein